MYCKKLEKEWKDRLDAVSTEKNLKIKELEDKGRELTENNSELNRRVSELEKERVSHLDKISSLESALT